MKWSHLIVAGALSLSVTSICSAQILMSRHNFSSWSWSGNEICKPCHTPHNALAGMPRLWNHELTTATYQMRQGVNGTGTGTAAVDLDYRSRMCLSCHDGTVALDSFGGNTGSNYIPYIANLGTNLRDDHPIGSDAQYPPDPIPEWWPTEFKDASLLPTALQLNAWVDPNGVTRMVVGCMTCHDPHRRGFPTMLTMSNSASNLCRGCHLK